MTAENDQGVKLFSSEKNENLTFESISGSQFSAHPTAGLCWAQRNCQLRHGDHPTERLSELQLDYCASFEDKEK